MECTGIQYRSWRNIIHHYLWLFVVIITINPLCLFSQQVDPGWNVLRSTPSELIVEYSPVYLPSKEVRIGQQTFTTIDFLGSISFSFQHKGYPDIRFASSCIGVPSRTIHTTIIAATYDEVPGISLPPIQVMDGRMNEATTDNNRQKYPAYNQAAYSSMTYLPDTLGRVIEIREVQQMLVANIEIFPIQFNAAAHSVRKYNRIVIQIQFGSPAVYTIPAASTSPILSVMLNKETARSWRTRLPVLKKVPTPSVLASSDWYRIEIKNTGLYKLDYTMLKNAGINVDQIDPRTIKIFNNGGRELPEPLSVSRPSDLVENSILVNGEEDGKFDPTDVILFYGRSPRGWKYDQLKKTFRHYINDYTESNYYWLTYNGVPGKRMSVVPETESQNPYRPTGIVGKIFYEEEINKIILGGEDGSGRAWYGPKLTSQSSSLSRRETLSDAIPGNPVRIRVKAVARADERTTMLVSQDNNALGSIAFSAASSEEEADEPAQVEFNGKVPTGTAQTMIQFQYGSQSVSAEAYLDWYDILYWRESRAINDELPFDAPDTNAVVLYHLDGFSSTDVKIFDVSDYANVKIMQMHAAALTGYELQVQASSGSISSYFAVASPAYKIPLGIQKMANSNLHEIDPSADLLIITHKDFWDAASRLTTYRNAAGRNSMKTAVVDVADIYNEFSSGQLDPVAIRDYIRLAYTSWVHPPKYVLLFGDGTYDYKNILGRGLEWIPPYETEESLDYIDSYTYDDFYVMLDLYSKLPTIAIGRITCRSLDEANIWVDKIINYETSTDFEEWRDLLVFCADDGLKSESQTNSETYHTEDTEALSNLSALRRFDQKKIYLVEYPTVLSSSGRTKPDAAEALINQWNRGALMISWMGHGNPEYWAHEHVFDRTKTIPRLNNGSRLPLVAAATCDFGHYDALEQSSAEDLASRKEGGSIVTIATSRPVFGSFNAMFMISLYKELLGRTDSIGQIGRLGDAWIRAKQNPSDLTNNQKFLIIGDPSILPLAPRALIVVDSINAIGAGGTGTILIPALKKTTVQGHLHPPLDVPGTQPMQISFVVRDGNKHVSLVDELDGHFDFNKSGEILFRGIVTVSNGKYTGTFIPPKDISYSDNNGRITLYANDGTQDAVGYSNSILIGAVDSTTVTDTQGPQISLFLQSRNFRSGDIVNENPTLYVDLFDENGINLSTASIGHGLDMWLDEASKSVLLSEYYRSAPDSYQKGTIEYPLQSLSSGDHTLKVRAWDVFNNSTTAETKFRVASSDVFAVTDVMNYPNPFSSQTTFTFNQNQIEGVDVEIKIYTVAGRLIRTLKEPGISESFVRIPWDGADGDGSPLANGVYLYKVIVKTASGEKTQEVIGKLAVLK
ncbi:MAG: type IX secretion system sortase PorU [Bacteroidota bacterium]